MSTSQPHVSPARTAWRELVGVKQVRRRWPFALRAGICMAAPVVVGWAAGDVTAGLAATLGSFTALYGSGRPYLYRAQELAIIAVSLAVAVAVGVWAAHVPWAGVLTVSVIAMVAVFVCNALAVGPPGAYMIVLASAAGIGIAEANQNAWYIGLLVLAGGAFSWLVHMSGALAGFRRPERAAVSAAAEAVALFAETVGSDDHDAALHRAAHALHESWILLVNFQPTNPRPSGTLQRLRDTNHRLHVLFANTIAQAAVSGQAAREARQLGSLDPTAAPVPRDADQLPLGRPSSARLLRQAAVRGSHTRAVTVRVGVSVLLAGFAAMATGVDHAYWAMAAVVLVLNQGADRVRTLVRGVQRLAGTWIGLVLAGAIFVVHPEGLWLAGLLVVLEFLIEMLVVRNYALAVIFITPLALTIASGGQPVTDVGRLLLARGLETTLGCVVALTVFVLTTRRYDATRLRTALAATLEAAATVCDHLQSATATSADARTARRDLQIGAMSMLAAYNAALLGPGTARHAAERMWPAVAAAERLAYRELAECWAMEHPGANTADTSLASGDGPSALRQLAVAVRSGAPPSPLGNVSPMVADDVAAIRSSLTG